MAWRCGSFLFAMVLISWISCSAALSPKEASSSQNFINCVPCSKTYLADSYLDPLTGQLAQDSDLTEVSDSTDLCKGLVDVLDVPSLSELNRQLVGEGSHRHLVYSLKSDNCQDAVDNFLHGHHANLVIIEKLPNGVFVDPFELQHFVERKVFLDVAVFGDTNLELPSALSNRSIVEIHFDLGLSASVNCNLVMDLPLHARYPPLDASGYATVEIGSPDLFLRYRKRVAHSNSCLWMLQHLDTTPVEKATWRIPCGDKAQAGFVSIVTFVSAVVSSMSIILAASFFHAKTIEY